MSRLAAIAVATLTCRSVSAEASPEHIIAHTLLFLLFTGRLRTTGELGHTRQTRQEVTINLSINNTGRYQVQQCAVPPFNSQKGLAVGMRGMVLFSANCSADMHLRCQVEVHDLSAALLPLRLWVATVTSTK